MKTGEFPPIRHAIILFLLYSFPSPRLHFSHISFSNRVPLYLFQVSQHASSAPPFFSGAPPRSVITLLLLLSFCFHSLFFFFTPLDNVFTATRNVCQGQPEKHLDFEQVHLTAVKRKRKKGPVPVHINLFLRATLWLKSSASSRFPRQQNFSGVSFIALALNPDPGVLVFPPQGWRRESSGNIIGVVFKNDSFRTI